MPSQRSPWQRLPGALFAPVDIASLVVVRICFGALGLWEVWRYAENDWIARYYIRPDFHFTFYGFQWVEPWGGDGMYWHFGAMAVLAICIIVGFCYRAAATLFFLAFTYVFLLEKAKYLNHLYLYCLVAFLLIFLPAHRSLSVDAWLRPSLRSENTPAWTVWMLRFQMGVVYFFAGIAKINGDWLRGWPLRLWLPPHDDFPVIGPLFEQLWFQVFFSYGGLLLDLLVPFFLLWPRTRMVAFLFTLFFHFMNNQLFGIGIFPLLSVAMTLPFFPPDWPRRVFNWPRRAAPPSETGPSALSSRQKLVAAGIAFWVVTQTLIPLRHFLYPGNVSWTEEGHNFAWHQKLRDKDSRAVFYVTDTGSRAVFEVEPAEYLTRRQVRKMGSRPHMVLEFAHFLRDEFERDLGNPVEVRARVECSLNGRRYQPLVDPQVDLAKQPWNLWPKSWVVPLTEPLRP